MSVGRKAARHAARLAAVQALYQMELTGEDAESVAEEFREHRFKEMPTSREPDSDFFADLLQGVPRHQVEIDRTIAQALSENWALQRIDSILRAILRAGVYELVERKDVRAKEVIREYVIIARAFFSSEESAFVNGLLERVARKKRSIEFGEKPPDDELRF